MKTIALTTPTVRLWHPLIAILLLALLLLTSCSGNEPLNQSKIYAPAETATTDAVPANQSTANDFAYSYTQEGEGRTAPFAATQTMDAGSSGSTALPAREENAGNEETLPQWKAHSVDNEATQYFTIDNRENAIITGAKGIKVMFPAGCLNLANPDEKVTIELKEFLTLSDMFFANLTTTSNGQMIETGGTVYVKATQNGQEVGMKAGEQIALAFPKGKATPQTGMQAFYGETFADPNNPAATAVNWQASNLAPANTYSLATIVDTIATPTHLVLTAENFRVKSPKTDRLPTGLTDSKAYTNIMEYMYDNMYLDPKLVAQLSGFRVNVYCNIDVTGKPYHISFVKIRDKSKYKNLSATQQQAYRRLKRNVKDVLYNMPYGIANTKPGVDRDNFELYVFKFKKKGTYRDLATQYSYSYITRNNPGYTKAQFDSAMANDASYFFINSEKLHYINCDKFFPLTIKTDLIVGLPQKSGRQVTILFPGIKSLMNAWPTDGKYVVGSVPIGRKIKIIVTEIRGDGKYYYAIKDGNTSKYVSNEFDFKPYSKEELDKALASLN